MKSGELIALAERFGGTAILPYRPIVDIEWQQPVRIRIAYQCAYWSVHARDVHQSQAGPVVRHPKAMAAYCRVVNMADMGRRIGRFYSKEDPGKPVACALGAMHPRIKDDKTGREVRMFYSLRKGKLGFLAVNEWASSPWQTIDTSMDAYLPDEAGVLEAYLTGKGDAGVLLDYIWDAKGW
jgi:hypothetical protein